MDGHRIKMALMNTPGRFLIALLICASVCVDLAVSAVAEAGDSGIMACLLGLVLGQIGLVSLFWLRNPKAWHHCLSAMGAIVSLGAFLLADNESVPVANWMILLSLFASISVSLPAFYRMSTTKAPLQFSLATLFGITTLFTMLFMAILNTNFPWHALPIAIPGLMLWAAPAYVCISCFLLTEDRQRSLVGGMMSVLGIALALVFFLPPAFRGLPQIVAWESFYLLCAGVVIAEAMRNDALLATGRTDRRQRLRARIFNWTATKPELSTPEFSPDRPSAP